MPRPPLKILLASPRGFCAGVDRAIAVVETTLEKHGPPVYVRHEIVHNRHVVESLEEKGAVFVEELDEIPDGVPVVFSAHGVARSVFDEAGRRGLDYLDATCPLVTKVHVDARRRAAEGRHVLLIGHAGHPEVVGTMGHLRPGGITLIETEADAERIAPADPEALSYVTQTTLSVDETARIIDILTRRFPNIRGPDKQDICYATTNRQRAVKEIARDCDALVVLGAPNSSNANRLAETARGVGCRKTILVQSAEEMDPAWLDGVRRLGVSAGASTPEVLVRGLIEACAARFSVTVDEVAVTRETLSFSLPRALTS